MTEVERRRIEVLALRNALQELYHKEGKIISTLRKEGAKLMIYALERRITKLERGEL
jgi:hypothetical protein